ncbi:unnamed protein product [Pleuronectes platessa]|uniref:Uncharacterized protein n=1 Tax=Pleuronectes platessa TaxID=8262 RepID=A0A9N7UKK5_PLEPL|nr:unnamed protein product [Pleuronectes platessa]
MPDFQRSFPGLITCCRSPTCLPRLCPGYYLSLLSSTTSFAYSLLVTLLLGSVATQLTTGPVCQLAVLRALPRIMQTLGAAGGASISPVLVSLLQG